VVVLTSADNCLSVLPIAAIRFKMGMSPLLSKLQPNRSSRLKSRTSVSSVMLNFGPQHPAAHGILKIGLALSGEIVIRGDLQFGLLHRGSEKLCENRTVNQSIPYLDRMDYVANLIQEHAVILSIESLFPTRDCHLIVGSIRILCDELSRVLNHLLTMSAVCLDLGSMGPIF
jgi:NADH-quinone oxidoreductase subunit D